MKAGLLILCIALIAATAVLTASWQAPRTEATVRSASEDALREADLGFTLVAIDGLDITLTGAAPSPELGARAVGVVESVDGVRSVTNRLGILPSPGDPVAECQSAIRRLLDPKPIQFRSGSAEIELASHPLLEEILSILEGCPNATIQIGGYTDNVGKPETNRRLSEARAESVLRYLADHDVALERMTALGFGEAKPVDTNDTEAGRRRNRRIEFILWKGQS